MKIQYCSDLHLEFPDNKEYLKSNPIIPIGEILILAGDIMPLKTIKDNQYFIDEISEKFKTIYWVSGNHEYYYYNLEEKSDSFYDNIRHNVHLVNNVSVEINNILFIFSTLWSNISENHKFQVQKQLSDFYVIGYGNDMLNTTQYNKLHKNSLKYLKKELSASKNEKNIVVTHHVPTFLNYPEKYKGDVLNDAFATELFDFIDKSKADYWLYGHHHYNPEDFMIGNTKMVTNQLGYVKYNEHKLFDSNKIIQIV